MLAIREIWLWFTLRVRRAGWPRGRNKALIRRREGGVRLEIKKKLNMSGEMFKQ